MVPFALFGREAGHARSGRAFILDEQLRDLSTKGDTLERLNRIVNFEMFHPDLERAVAAIESRQGRPAVI